MKKIKFDYIFRFPKNYHNIKFLTLEDTGFRKTYDFKVSDKTKITKEGRKNFSKALNTDVFVDEDTIYVGLKKNDDFNWESLSTFISFIYAYDNTVGSIEQQALFFKKVNQDGR